MGMTQTQKILAAHAGLAEVKAGQLINAKLDIVLGNDITTPVAINEFEKAGFNGVFDKEHIAIVLDHFVPNKDIKSATQSKQCREFANKYDILNFYDVGQMGIEHALLPEKGIVTAGDCVIGADSHTCTYGALGAFSTGVGSTDMAAGMATGMAWFKVPAAIKFVLNGKLPPKVSGKDLILHIIGMIGVDGALYKSMEFTGPGVASLSMDDRLSICNMAIEAGAKNGIFPVDDVTKAYLKGRSQREPVFYEADPDAEYEQTVAKLWEEYELTLSAAQELCVPFESGAELRRQVSEVRGKIKALGNVNVSAIEEYKEVKARYDELSHQVTDVEESRNELSRMIAKLSAQMREIFTDSFRAINENFSRVFTELFGGGEASLVLEDESDVLACGIGIRVAPPGKVIKNLEALSGGEQALVAISIYFAILAVNPAPFCILDEIEAALDDANVVRFAQYLRRISDKTQFIVITHRRGTMEAANVLYGVTMQEDGVSKLLKLDLEQVDATLVS